MMTLAPGFYPHSSSFWGLRRAHIFRCSGESAAQCCRLLSSPLDTHTHSSFNSSLSWLLEDVQQQQTRPRPPRGRRHRSSSGGGRGCTLANLEEHTVGELHRKEGSFNKQILVTVLPTFYSAPTGFPTIGLLSKILIVALTSDQCSLCNHIIYFKMLISFYNCKQQKLHTNVIHHACITFTVK